MRSYVNRYSPREAEFRHRDDYRAGEYDRGRYRQAHSDEDRDVLDRMSDEVSSWFGDREAARRRRYDEREQRRPRRGNGASRHDARSGISAREVMSRDVATVMPDDTVEQASRLMREYDCGALPVVGWGGRLLGMITDRDITVRLVARGEDTRRARVAECMTEEVFACHLSEDLDDCMRTMSRHQIRRLPIVDDDRRVVGILSQSDLARHAGENHGRGERRAVADVVCAVSEPSGSAYR